MNNNVSLEIRYVENENILSAVWKADIKFYFITSGTTSGSVSTTEFKLIDTYVGSCWTYMVKTRKWGGASNPTIDKAGLMNINNATRRSSSRIRRRHHPVSKPGSV